jgi:type II secretory pathway pseudopilin PulG
MALEDSGAGRVIGALVSPVKTFQSIAARPTWLVALVILALLGSVLGPLVNARTDQRQMIEKQMAKFGVQMSKQQLEEAVQRAKNPPPVLKAVQLVIGLVLQTLTYLVPALILFVVFKLGGSELTYKSSLSTYLYASIPFGIGLLLTIPIVFARTVVQPVDTLTGRLMASNIAFFLPDSASPALRGALSSFDVFNLWSLALAVVGYRIVARVSTSAAVIAAGLIFLLGMGIRAGFATFMS